MTLYGPGQTCPKSGKYKECLPNWWEYKWKVIHLSKGNQFPPAKSGNKWIFVSD